MLKDSGRKQEAVSLYREAIRLDPSQVQLRERLQIVSGDRPAMDLVPATNVQPILAAAKAAKPGGMSAIVFLDEMRQVVYPDFASIARFHRIVKVFDQAAVERYQTLHLSRSELSANLELETARILKPDGKVQNVAGGGESDASAGELALPSLSPGDVVDVAYRVENYRRGALSRQFWSQWFFTESDAPVKLSRCVLMTPPSLNYELRSHGRAPEPSDREVKGWRIREWHVADVPPLKMEVLGVSPADAGDWIDLSTISSWTDIVRWYRDLSQPRCMPDAAIKAKAAELTRNATTEDEKLHAIISFVRSIQYQTTPFRLSAYVPTEGKRVLLDRYADCKDKAALLTALLASVNIRSNMVLLSGRSHGLTPYLPSPRFNHAIAVVQTSKGSLWVDATANQMAVGDFPSEDQGVPALIIGDNTTDLAPTPSDISDRDHVTDNYDLTLDEAGRLTGSVELRATGNMAWILRSMLASIPETKRQEGLRGIAGQIVKGSVFESGSMEGVEDPDKPVVIKVKVHVDDYSSKAGSFLLVKLPWSLGHDVSDDVLTDPSRQQDVEVSALRNSSRSTLTLRLPRGYAVQDLQPEAKGESPFNSYHITYRVEDGVLHAVGEQQTKSLRIPLASLKQYLDVMRSARQEGSKQLVLKKS